MVATSSEVELQEPSSRHAHGGISAIGTHLRSPQYPTGPQPHHIMHPAAKYLQNASSSGTLPRPLPPPPGVHACMTTGFGSLPRCQDNGGRLPHLPYHNSSLSPTADEVPEYAEAGPPTSTTSVSRIDQLMERHQYMTLPSSSRNQNEYNYGGSSYDYGGSTEPLPAPLIEKHDNYSLCSALFTVLSLLLYTVNLATDAGACVLLYREGNLWWFGLTLGLTVIPAVTVNAFSLRWYIQDDRESREAKDTSIHRPRMGCIDWLLRIVFHLAFLGPVIRYMELLVFGLKSRSKELKNRKRQRQWHLTPVRLEQPKEQHTDYYLLMIHEDRDTALLSLLNGFMQAAPQSVIQLSILIQRYEHHHRRQPWLTVTIQASSVVTSIILVAWALASYQRALRRSVPEKRNMSRIGSLLQFLWRLGTVSGRSIALALFAVEYRYWLLPLCIGHWGVMSVWVMHQGTRFCDTEGGRPRPCYEYTFDMLIGAIYLFCFLNVKDEPTRYKYASYYVIVFLENVIMIGLWYLRAPPTLWFRLIPLIAVPALSGLGVLIMVLYYRYHHPNGRMALYNPLARCC